MEIKDGRDIKNNREDNKIAGGREMTFKLLLLYIITLPLMKTPRLPFLEYRLILSEVVFLSLFLLWMKGLIKNKKLPQDTGLNRPFLLFMFFCLLSFFNSSNLLISIVEISGLIYLYVMVILVVDLIDNKRKLDTVIKVWVGTLAVVLALGLIGWCMSTVLGKNNFFAWHYSADFPYLGKINRPVSTFRHPLGLANYLIVSLGLMVSELLLAENKRYKVFLKFMIFFAGLTMIATVSREIFAFIFSISLIFFYFHKGKNLRFKIIRFLSICLLISMLLFSFIFCSLFYIRSYKVANFSEENHKKLVIDVDYAYHTKLAFKVAALEMVKRHPFSGVGLAMYRPYLEKLNDKDYFKNLNLIPIYSYHIGTLFCDYLPANDPHCDVLQYYAETGIFGGSAFILFIAIFLCLIFTNLRKRPDDRYFKVRLFCFFASFAGVLVESIDVDVFKLRPVWFLMALTLALIMMRNEKN